MFTHLHVASCFSAHHGTARPEVLVEAAAAQGAACAITDRDGLYGAVRHVRACMNAGLPPIVGVDLRVGSSLTAELCDITVLAHGATGGAGWAGLCRLISAAHTRPEKTAHGTVNRAARLRIDRPAEILSGEDGPVGTVLLGPGSDVGQAVLAGDQGAATRLLTNWMRRMPGAVAVEVVCHYTRPGTAASLIHAADMLRLARAVGVPAVLSNAVRYLSPDDALTGDVLDAAAQLLPLEDTTLRPNAQAWFKPPKMMQEVAFEIASDAGLGKQGAVELLDATETLAARCTLDPDGDLAWRSPKVPELSLLGVDGDPNQVLRARCEAAVPSRYSGDTDLSEVWQRLDMELGTIEQFGFASYFLVVADVADMIRGMGIRVQARGSGAGSLVNYLLHIGTVDPLAHDLLFERFLGGERSTLPDIDIDVESARRHEIYRAIFKRYGEHRVTLLSMQNKYRARGAVRDAGLALGLTASEIDQVADSLWRLNARDLRRSLDTKPELRDLAAVVRQDRRLELLVDLTERLDRLPRHISMHPCGVILGNQNLLSVTPVQPSGLGLPMSQYDKDDVDDMGLLKLDVLGVRMHSTIAHTIAEIKRINGPQTALAGGLPVDVPYISSSGHLDLDAVPLDDEATFETIRSTHTLGIFQIESPGQRELVGKMQPDVFEDLIADTSLFRPGPMKANMISPFVEAKLGITPRDYLHPLFRPFLESSFGVIIYHEHVLRILRECMGVSLAKADELRRSMGGWSKVAPGHRGSLTWFEAEFRKRTVARVDEQGKRVFSDKQIDQIWGALVAFGSFGFCKAHAAEFAHTIYETAWLKTHYPAEFLSGLLEHDPGMYPRRLLMAEARRLGIPLLPPDVQRSTAHYYVEPTETGEKGIRISLKDIRGISDAELSRLVANQPYSDITDCYLRAKPSRTLLQRLAAVGALDVLAPEHSRSDIIAHVRKLTAKPRGTVPKNQATLLDATCEQLPDGTPELSTEACNAAELEVLGSEIQQHMLEDYRPFLDAIDITPSDQLINLRNHSEVLVAGVRVATGTPPTKSGKRVVFISLDDGVGISDCTFFDEAQQRIGSTLFGTRLLIVQGHTRRTGARGISVEATNAWDLKTLWRQWNETRRSVEESEDALADMSAYVA